MRSQIKGTTMPVLEIGLEPNDRIVAEPGEFSWMTDGVQMRTTTYTAGARGIWGAIGRAFSGGGLFMTEYSAPAGRGVQHLLEARLPDVEQSRSGQVRGGHLRWGGVGEHGALCPRPGWGGIGGWKAWGQVPASATASPARAWTSSVVTETGGRAGFVRGLNSSSSSAGGRFSIHSSSFPRNTSFPMLPSTTGISPRSIW